jgi:type II secretory pathway pseudopilin PulG
LHRKVESLISIKKQVDNLQDMVGGLVRSSSVAHQASQFRSALMNRQLRTDEAQTSKGAAVGLSSGLAGDTNLCVILPPVSGSSLSGNVDGSRVQLLCL